MLLAYMRLTALSALVQAIPTKRATPQNRLHKQGKFTYEQLRPWFVLPRPFPEAISSNAIRVG